MTKDAAHWLRKEAEFNARAERAEARAARLRSMADAAWFRAQPPREPDPRLLPVGPISTELMRIFGRVSNFDSIVNKDYEA